MEYVELVLVNGDVEYLEYDGKFNRDYLMKYLDVIESVSGYSIPVEKIVKYKVSKKKQWGEKVVGGKLTKNTDSVSYETVVNFKPEINKEKLDKIFDDLKREILKDRKPYI